MTPLFNNPFSSYPSLPPRLLRLSISSSPILPPWTRLTPNVRVCSTGSHSRSPTLTPHHNHHHQQHPSLPLSWSLRSLSCSVSCPVFPCPMVCLFFLVSVCSVSLVVSISVTPCPCAHPCLCPSPFPCFCLLSLSSFITHSVTLSLTISPFVYVFFSLTVLFLSP